MQGALKQKVTWCMGALKQRAHGAGSTETEGHKVQRALKLRAHGAGSTATEGHNVQGALKQRVIRCREH